MATKSNFRHHIEAVHKNSKPDSCKECSKDFGQNRTLIDTQQGCIQIYITVIIEVRVVYQININANHVLSHVHTKRNHHKKINTKTNQFNVITVRKILIT